ncbi:MAG: 2-nitropropane dioxygenase [Epulopiscium sp. Nuni2H_MBin003]|nr:MAG: 2-nitropropane dioxygenase [Epulopiscium sp. Nuni2H_MBin003]
MNRVCDIVGIKYPIFQGAMAWIADHSLVAAVSNAGGLGIIAAGNAPVEWVEAEIKKCRQKTDKPFGVNVMLLSPYANEVAELIAKEQVAVVTTGAGNPSKYMELWQSQGIKVVPVVASVALAKRMEKYGADAVIAEGTEAGGHIGEVSTMVLIPQVVDALNIPVIAAGGIGDGRGFAASLMLGAEAVQVGTRFLLAKECTVHQNYKDKIITASDLDAVATGRSTGHPVRGIRNKMTREFLKLEKEGTPLEELEQLGSGALRAAVKDGDVINGSVMSGQIAGMLTKEQTAQEIINDYITELATISKKELINF